MWSNRLAASTGVCSERVAIKLQGQIDPGMNVTNYSEECVCPLCWMTVSFILIAKCYEVEID